MDSAKYVRAAETEQRRTATGARTRIQIFQSLNADNSSGPLCRFSSIIKSRRKGVKAVNRQSGLLHGPRSKLPQAEATNEIDDEILSQRRCNCLCRDRFFRGWHLAPKDGIEEIKRSDPVLRVSSFSKSSPIYQAAEDYRRWLSGDKKFSEKTGDLSLADKFLLSGRYIDKGVSRLPTALLEERLSSVGKILASLDTHTCGRYLRGEMPYSEFENRIFPVMESFSEAESKAWFAVNRAAIEAQLNEAPIIVLLAEDAKRTIRKLLSSMYEPQSKEFLAALGSLKAADDDDACRTARILYVRGNSLPEPYRGYMARMLLTRDEGREEP